MERKRACVWAKGVGVGEREGCLRESVCVLPGHGVPSWGCWGCVGGAVRGGTAESPVVPLRKKSDIREGRGQKGDLHLNELPNQNYKKEEDRGGGVI